MLVMKPNNNGIMVIKYEYIYIRSSLRVLVFFCQVMVLVAGGGYAEYVAVHMGTVMKIPEGISMIDAAG